MSRKIRSGIEIAKILLMPIPTLVFIGDCMEDIVGIKSVALTKGRVEVASLISDSRTWRWMLRGALWYLCFLLGQNNYIHYNSKRIVGSPIKCH